MRVPVTCRHHPLAWLLLLAACGGNPAPRPAPVPSQAPAPAPAPHRPDLTDQSAPAPPGPPPADTPLPPPPASDAEELQALLKQAADDAADSALLATIASAPAGTPGTGNAAALPNPLRASGVTWDIDVESYEDHDRVQYWVEFFSGKARSRFGIWLERMARYEPMIRTRLGQQGLPGDLVYLALIESGFSNTAVSRARAVGMWQFMRPTARGIGLVVDRWVDERRDPVRATDAAARHLDMLRRQFGSLYLAAAAYNAGGGKVSRSLAKMERMRPAQGDDGSGGAADEPEDDEEEGWSDDDFFRLRNTQLLRQETKDYVPKLIAAAIIAKEPARYGFTDLRPEPVFEADSLVVNGMTGLDVVARLAGTSVAVVRELNPQYLRGATPPGRTSVVRVPAGTGAAARVAYAELPAAERVSFATHVARKGETLTRVARRYGVSVADLREANPGVTRLRAGTRLLVPRGGAVSAVTARSVRAAETAEYHRVRKGETATRIARRYGISVKELKAWNRGRIPASGRVRAGTRLLVSEPAEPVRAEPASADPAPRAKARTTKPRAGTATAAAPATRRHLVRAGETLTGLARRYGTSVKAIQEANGLRAGGIRTGQRLRIPG